MHLEVITVLVVQSSQHSLILFAFHVCRYRFLKTTGTAPLLMPAVCTVAVLFTSLYSQVPGGWGVRRSTWAASWLHQLGLIHQVQLIALWEHLSFQYLAQGYLNSEVHVLSALGFEPGTFRFSAQPPTEWAPTTPSSLVWTKYSPTQWFVTLCIPALLWALNQVTTTWVYDSS